MNTTSQTEFDTLAAQAEVMLKRNPRRYKLEILLYALLGYAFIVLMLLLLFSLTAAVFGSMFISGMLFVVLLKSKLLYAFIPGIWVLLKSLWVRMEPPAGYELTLRDVPALEQEIRALRSRLKSVRVHRVILTPEFNAAVVQTPRLGVFGWHRNTLLLGLELLLALSPEQARAVLAHEFGHLSGNHSRFNGWIYRVRTSWGRLAQTYQGLDSLGARLMLAFFNWYAPRFSAYTFALARANEYEADAIAAEMTSARATVEALINTHVTSSYANEDYWRQFVKQADILPEPDRAPWTGLTQFINECRLSQEVYRARLNDELLKQTDNDDTHPALKDRIAALKAAAQIPPAVQQTAAALWLGDKLQHIIREFDKTWIEENLQHWRDRHEYAVNGRKELEQLAAKTPQELSDDELWSKATLTEELVDENAALPFYQAMQARHPENPRVAFALGRLLCNRNDEAGLQQMKMALTEPRLALEACQYACHFLNTHNRSQEIAWWQQRYNEQKQILIESERERTELRPGDPLEKTELTAALRDRLAAALRRDPRVKRAWLAGKKLRHFPEYPSLVFVLELKGFVLRPEQQARRIVESLHLEHDFFAIPKSGEHGKMARQAMKVGERLV